MSKTKNIKSKRCAEIMRNVNVTICDKFRYMILEMFYEIKKKTNNEDLVNYAQDKIMTLLTYGLYVDTILIKECVGQGRGTEGLLIKIGAWQASRLLKDGEDEIPEQDRISYKGFVCV